MCKRPGTFSSMVSSFCSKSLSLIFPLKATKIVESPGAASCFSSSSSSPESKSTSKSSIAEEYKEAYVSFKLGRSSKIIVSNNGSLSDAKVMLGREKENCHTYNNNFVMTLTATFNGTFGHLQKNLPGDLVLGSVRPTV